MLCTYVTDSPRCRIVEQDTIVIHCSMDTGLFPLPTYEWTDDMSAVRSQSESPLPRVVHSVELRYEGDRYARVSPNVRQNPKGTADRDGMVGNQCWELARKFR